MGIKGIVHVIVQSQHMLPLTSAACSNPSRQTFFDWFPEKCVGKCFQLMCDFILLQLWLIVGQKSYPLFLNRLPKPESSRRGAQLMSHELYQGTTLPNKRSIRLLTLHAGGSLPLSSPVVCELRVVTLPDVDSGTSWPYYALSYAWREPTTRLKTTSGEVAISCNDINIAIPNNLFVALVRLRQKFQEPATIWIDYLCIDQSNTSERTQQVALMQEIFSLASEVLIWLGEPSSTGLHESGKTEVHYHWGEDNAAALIGAYQDSFREYLRGGNLFKLPKLGHAYGAFCLLNLLSRRVPVSQISFCESSVDSLEFKRWLGELWTAVWEMIDRAWVSCTRPGINVILAKN